MRLNSAISTFTKIIAEQTPATMPSARPTGCRSPWISAKPTASTMFVNGPTAATRSMSRRGLPILSGSIGTGFAQPKMNRLGVGRNRIAAGTMSVPTRSRWRSGLIDSRPCSAGVGSPSRAATKPCAASCIVIATMAAPANSRMTTAWENSPLKNRRPGRSPRGPQAAPPCGQARPPGRSPPAFPAWRGPLPPDSGRHRP